MTWPFCPQCGTILDPPDSSDEVVCTSCPFRCSFLSLGVAEVTTTSAPSSKQQWLKDVEEEPSNQKAREKHAVIEEPCPKCSHKEMYFYTMQLRSVDEGQTVFYECPACEYKYSVNN